MQRLYDDDTGSSLYVQSFEGFESHCRGMTLDEEIHGGLVEALYNTLCTNCKMAYSSHTDKSEHCLFSPTFFTPPEHKRRLYSIVISRISIKDAFALEYRDVTIPPHK